MAPVVEQKWSPACDKDILKGCSDDTRRERQQPPILASRGEVVFTSIDMKTYRTKPKSEASVTGRSANLSEREDTPASGSKNDDKLSSPTPPDKSAQLLRDLHGTKRLKALLLQDASKSIPRSKDNEKDTDGKSRQQQTKNDKQPNSYAASRRSPRQPHDQYAFVKNVKPSMVKLALQYAKPINENVKKETHRKKNDATDGDVNSEPKRIKEKEYPRDKSTSEKMLDVRRFVRTLRNECDHVGLLWMAPPLFVGTAVFLVLFLTMCASLVMASIMSLIPLLEKIADEAFRRLYRFGYLYETEDESTCRDFLEKLICKVETRTKAKITEQLKQGLSPKDV